MARLSALLLFLLAVLAAACQSLSPEEEEMVSELRLRATQYYETNDLPRAEQQARRGLEIDPENADLHHILGRTLLKSQEAGRLVAAQVSLLKAYELDPKYTTAYSLGECHLRLGELRLDRAARLDLRALEVDPQETSALQDLADRAAKLRRDALHDLQEAERMLKRSLEANPDYVYALRLLANAYTHLERPEEALATLEELIRILGQSRAWKNERLALEALPMAEEQVLRVRLLADLKIEVEARGLVATIHKAAKRYSLAADALTEILKLDPDRVQEYFNRGLCRYWLGDLASAHADMREFLRRTNLGFDSVEVGRALDIVSEYEAPVAGRDTQG